MIPEINIKFSKFISILGVILFFIPKINLISVQQGESAGIRVDDILIVCMFSYVVIGFLLSRRKSITYLELTFGCLIAFFLLSNVINLFLYSQSNILYSVRYIEYFLFFYIGYYFSLRYKINKLILWLLAINGFFMILQVLNILGGFASGGFASSASERAIGLTGGPWEIGAVINFIFAIYLFGEKKYSGWKVFFIFLVTFLLILISGSRMPTIAHLLLLATYIFSISKNKFLLVLSTVAVALVIAFGVVYIPNPVTERSANLFSQDNIDQFVYAYKQIPISRPYVGFPSVVDFDASGDLSWLMRVSKWTYAIKDFASSPYLWPIGLGPGIWGLALDGGWVRLMTETGIIGTTIFIVFFYKAAKISKVIMGIVLALYINMIMIDIHIAYKAMAFVFFAIGYYYQKSVSSKKPKFQLL